MKLMHKAILHRYINKKLPSIYMVNIDTPWGILDILKPFRSHKPLHYLTSEQLTN